MWENVQQVVRDVTKNPSPPVCVDIPTGDTLLVSSSADTRYNKALFIKKNHLKTRPSVHIARILHTTMNRYNYEYVGVIE